jgi:hypothetical protein
MPDFSGITGDVNAGGSLIGFSITLAGLAFEVFSAHCSSPWTSESFGADPDKAASARRYVKKSIIVTEVLGLGGVMLAHNVTPLIATSLVSAYMWWTYDRALWKAATTGSSGWGAKGNGAGFSLHTALSYDSAR